MWVSPFFTSGEPRIRDETPTTGRNPSAAKRVLRIWNRAAPNRPRSMQQPLTTRSSSTGGRVARSASRSARGSVGQGLRSARSTSGPTRTQQPSCAPLPTATRRFQPCGWASAPWSIHRQSRWWRRRWSRSPASLQRRHRRRWSVAVGFCGSDAVTHVHEASDDRGRAGVALRLGCGDVATALPKPSQP